MRILYIYDTPMPDTGADTEQVVNTLSALARRGHETALLIPGPESGPGDPTELARYYQVSVAPMVTRLAWRWHSVRGCEKWSHAFRAARHPALASAEVVYTRNLPAAYACLRAGHRVVYEHFRPWGDQIPPLQPFLRWILRHPKLVGAVFHSQHAAASYQRLGVSPERILVAHNGWDPTRMSPRLSRAEARQALGLAVDRFTVVYTGRINARKGLDLVLAAARGAPDMAFVLVGSEGGGPVEAEAATLSNVKVVPWQRFSALAPWLYAADALVIPPSLAPLERHGNTVLPLKLFLYLAAGRVIVAPRAPDTAELLEDGRNAALVPAGDPAQLGRRLMALASTPVEVERLGAGALSTAETLTWDARAERLERFLSQRLSANSSPASADPWRVGPWLGEVGRWLLGR